MNLEKRMYFFVPYNISPIQQGIQAGHCLGEYALKYGRYNPDHLVWDFLENWKTWIILNGGTTNSELFEFIPVGSLNQTEWELRDFGIEYATFIEPDLNNALTAVNIIADERVFNFKDYPDFIEWIRTQDFVDEDEKLNSFVDLKGKEPEELKKLFPGMYPEWVRQMGGEKNLFLRELTRYKKLA